MPGDNAAKISVQYGANAQTFDGADGKTVAELRRIAAEVLNVPDGAAAIVVGNRVNDDYVAQPGDVIEFVRAAGAKA